MIIAQYFKNTTNKDFKNGSDYFTCKYWSIQYADCVKLLSAMKIGVDDNCHVSPMKNDEAADYW